MKKFNVILSTTMAAVILLSTAIDLNSTMIVFGDTTKMTQEKLLDSKREDIQDKYKWDLTHMFSNDAELEKAIGKAMVDLEKFNKYNGKLKNPDVLFEVLELLEVQSEKITIIAFYEIMKSSENMNLEKNKELNARIKNLGLEFGQATSFISSELTEMTEQEIDVLLKSPKLKKYSKFLDNIFRKKAHILEKNEENILVQAKNILSLPSTIYNSLPIFGDYGIMVKNGKGEDVVFTPTTYDIALKSTDAVLRKNMHNARYEKYAENAEAVAATYVSHIKGGLFETQARGYNSTMERILDEDNISVEVYKNLIETVGNNLKPLHNYVSKRKKELKLDKFNVYDLNVLTLQNEQTNVEYEKAQETINKAFSIYGEDYVKTVQKQYDERLVDVYPSEDKSEGAFMSGAYGSKWYILLNYDNTLESMFTLAHELGHALHSIYTSQNQPQTYADYSDLLAEIASSVNEVVLLDYLTQNAKSKEEQKALNEYCMNQLVYIIFATTMFAEFEMIVHEMVQNGELVSANTLNELYGSLLKKYYGDDLEIDELSKMGWIYQSSRFFRDFFLYQYATGYSAGINIAEMMKKDNSYVEKYKNMLKAGASKYPTQILKDNGLDVTKNGYIQAALDKFNALVNGL